MCRQARKQVILAAAIGAMSLCTEASQGGSTFYWDTSDDPGLQGGTADWNTTVANLNPAADGSGARQAWADSILDPNSLVVSSESILNTTAVDGYLHVQDLTFNAPATINTGTSSGGASLVPKGIITTNADATITDFQWKDWTSGATGALVKAGTSTLTINSGALGKATTGNHPWIKAGTLKMGGYSALVGGQNEGPITWGGYLTVDAGATLEFNNNQQYMSGPIQGAGTVTNTGDTVVDLLMGTATPVPASSVVFAGNLNFAIYGTRGYRLNAQSTYAGKTRVGGTATTLSNGLDNALPIHTNLEIGLDAPQFSHYYTLNGFNQEVGILTSSGSDFGWIMDGTGDGVLTLNGQIYVNGVLTDTDATYAGGIKGAVSLVKNGNNTQVLTGSGSSSVNMSNSLNYGGTTTVNGGVLALDGVHTNGNGVYVRPSGTFVGTGITDETVAMLGGTISPGRVGTAGSLTVGGIDFNAHDPLTSIRATGSVGIFDLDSLAGLSDKLIVTGTDLFGMHGGTVQVSNLGGLQTGTYTLVDYAGVMGGSTSFMSVPDLPGFHFTLLNNAVDTTIELLVTGVEGQFWTGTTDGNWSLAGNWSGGVPNAIGAAANFGSITSGNYAVAVDGTAQTVGAMNFDNATSYTIGSNGGNSVILDASSGHAVINLTSGSHTIAAPLTLNDNLDVNVANLADTLTVSGAVTATGRVINMSGAGAAQFENVRASALNVNGGTVKMSAKGTANDAAGTSVVSSLSIVAGAQLDLTNNSMVVDYAGAAGTLEDDVRQHLQSGRLASSSATTSTKLGYADNAVLGQTSFAGQTVDADSMLIKFTYAGDANLDGQVTISDLGDLASNWQSTTAVWRNGDFNYDGSVTISDLGDLASNWQAGVGSPLGMSFQQALAAVGLGGVEVPEPTSLALLGVGALALRRRRN